MSEITHTPTPWRAEYDDNSEYLKSICHGNGRTIIRPHPYLDPESSVLSLVLTSCNYDSDFDVSHDRDIRFLLKAVNHHDELVAVLQGIADRLDKFGICGGTQAVEVIDARRLHAILAKLENP